MATNEPLNSAADEVAAAEAELKAAQEKLEAAKAKLAATTSDDACDVEKETVAAVVVDEATAAASASTASYTQPAGAPPAPGQPASGYYAPPGYGAPQTPPHAGPGAVPPQQPYYGYQQPYYQQPYSQPMVTTKDHVAAGTKLEPLALVQHVDLLEFSLGLREVQDALDDGDDPDHP